MRDAPGYGPLVDEDVSTKMNTTFFGSGGCNEKVLACYAAGETPESDQTCADAFQICVSLLTNLRNEKSSKRSRLGSASLHTSIWNPL